MNSEKEYILITPAYNEEAYLEKTIQSVIVQTLLPKKWVIVSDGSTDRTDKIASSYASKYNFIEFIRHEGESIPGAVLSYRKVSAIRSGFKRLGNITYDYYGNLDADITFKPDFYESLIAKFEKNSKLGLTGSFVYNIHKGKLYKHSTNTKNVSGAIQFFRRKCYEDIGGYLPVAFEDSLAVVMARMHGWKVTSLPEIRALHHKPAGIPGRNQFRAKFHVGKMEHITGDHFLYHFVRCMGSIMDKPILIGSFLRIFGYGYSVLKGNKVQGLPKGVLEYMRCEQLKRLRSIFLRTKL